jgi:FtsH-binding integral membrane protein
MKSFFMNHQKKKEKNTNYKIMFRTNFGLINFALLKFFIKNDLDVFIYSSLYKLDEK